MDNVRGLLGEERTLSVLEDAVRASAADQTELVLLADRTGVTRYANSTIQQNVEQANTRVSVRVAVARATVRVFTNSLERDALVAAIEQAVSLAKMRSPEPKFKSLPAAGLGSRRPDTTPTTYFVSTAGLSPTERAEGVGRAIDVAAAHGLSAFGTYRASAGELAVASSTGIRAYAPYTTAYFKALVEGPDGTGFADALDRDAARIVPERIAHDAVRKCVANRDQAGIEPGEYEAVFDPNAVADMVRFPVVTGAGARQVLDEQSFMSGKIGDIVAGDVVSLWDDPTDARCLPLPIDYEGMPAVRVDLIERGVARGPVYDVETALESGTRSTGHAPDPFEGIPSGPEANHIVMPVGRASTEELVRNVKRGVWVTRFHYTHCPDPKSVIATGTTRDGTFLIHDGEVVGALRNLRLEMSVLDLLSSTREVGAGKLCQDWWAANGMGATNYFVPAMRFGACRFTGVTTF